MMIAIPRPAAGPRLPWLWIALGGASIVAALYLSGALTGALSALYLSVVGVPALELLMALPTLLVLGPFGWAAWKITGRPWAAGLPLLPVLGWVFIFAPLQEARILRPLEGDGGALPIFTEHDVLAILDRTAPAHRSKMLCTATCVEILRNGELKAIFLPRYVSPDGTDTRGVIYRAATGQLCEEELAPRGVRPLCVSVTPASLWDVTHVLETYHLPLGDPAALGIHGGEQMRLTHRYSGEVLLQRTAFDARVPGRVPLLGDLTLTSAGAEVLPRMATRLISRPWEHPPLITLLHTSLERRANARR